MTTHRISPKYAPHISVEAWCGNTATGSKKFTFLDAPPPGKLLCARCEQKAQQAGKPSSESIVGRHVHLGGVVAVQKCCVEREQDNSLQAMLRLNDALLKEGRSGLVDV